MDWIHAVTNRQSGAARMTYEDMVRITGNINLVYDFLVDAGYTVVGQKVSKTSWTRDDIILDTFWAEMLGVLSNVCAAIEYIPQVPPNNSMWYQNINNIERIILDVFNAASAGVLLTESEVVITTETGEAITTE